MLEFSFKMCKCFQIKKYNFIYNSLSTCTNTLSKNTISLQCFSLQFVCRLMHNQLYMNNDVIKISNTYSFLLILQYNHVSNAVVFFYGISSEILSNFLSNAIVFSYIEENALKMLSKTLSNHRSKALKSQMLSNTLSNGIVFLIELSFKLLSNFLSNYLFIAVDFLCNHHSNSMESSLKCSHMFDFFHDNVQMLSNYLSNAVVFPFEVFLKMRSNNLSNYLSNAIVFF